VSYYTKGPVVGLLLDARIRRLTGNRRSLDDVMRLASARYSGAHGFTPEQFRAVASEVAGANLDDWFHHALDTTEELDYTEMLDWFGLRFTGGHDPTANWTLEVRNGATPAQRAHLAALLAP
jgi:predicted metalloprotease with PDZ domain